MGFTSRKFYVWLISLGAVLAIYLLYSRMSQTPEIDFNRRAEFTETVSDTNVGEHESKIGTIGKAGVGIVHKAWYEHRNKKTKKIDRVFGFEKLLHEIGDEWHIEKPYMNLFQRGFKCYITADEGKVLVKTAVGKAAPKDATFTGNVVIHILPGKSGNIKESFIYLDDIDFISERSLFTTTGPVKFVNEGAQMLGRGLEAIYNEQVSRLEFFRLIHLESLHLKSLSKAAFLSKETGVGTPAGPPTGAKVTPAAKQPVEQREGEYYRCVFRKNVFIDTPEQLIFADEFSISNIFWPKGSSGESEKNSAGGADNIRPESASAAKQTEPNKLSEELVEIVVTCDNGIIVVPVSSEKAVSDFDVFGLGGSTVTDSQKPGDLKEADGRTTLVARKINYCASTGDVVAGGPLELTFYPNDVTGPEPNETGVPVKITAQKEARFLAGLNQAIFEGDCLCTMPQPDSSTQRDYTLSAPRLTVNLPEGKSKQRSGSVDIFAAGPAELTFYVDVNDLSSPGTKETAVPAKVIAQKQAKFLSATNQVIFEGDCLCTMRREDPNVRQEYTLSAPKLTIDLPRDKNTSSPASATGIEHLRADGGLVRLSSVKRAAERLRSAKEAQNEGPGKLLGGIELKCTRFDYDSAQQVFLATGPGVIKFYNSSVSGSKTKLDRFSLQKRCWAFVEEFDTLNYLLESNLIIADAEPQGTLLINYFPIVKGQIQYDRQITATAGHIETLLYETPGRRTELSALKATGGITYEDEDKRFVGSKLFYDNNTSIVTVQGDQVQPCLLNGTFVDAIEYDLETDRVKAKILAPGALQMKR